MLQTKAKAVIERDMSKIRTKRAEKQRQANTRASQDQAMTEAVHVKPIEPSNDMPDKQDDSQTSEAADRQDITMSDALDVSAGGVSGNEQQPSDLAEASSGKMPVVSLEGMPQDSQNTTGLAISMPDDIEAKTPQPKNEPPPSQTLPSGTITDPENTTNPVDDPSKLEEEINFDALFNDTEGVPQDGPLDFDFDFTTGEDATQEIMNGTAVEGVDMNSADIANALPGTSEDLNSLLPGLESFVNDTDVAANKAPNNNPPPRDQSQSEQHSGNEGEMQANAQPSLDNSGLDDFFSGANFDSTEGAGNPDSNLFGDDSFGQMEDFSDDWWKDT